MPSAPDRDADRHRLRLFLSGDEGTARALTAIARETVARRAFGLDPAERDDLVQESIAQLWAACTRDGFDLDSTLDGFVRTITTARCIDHFRRRRWQQELHESIPLEAEHPLDEIHRERTLEAVRKAVASLRPLCRDLIQWHFHEGQRYDQIAARTGRAASTLRVHMHRCLRQLRTTLKVEGEVS
ncbi:MAG TPA: sigma-70 family RNA polymerase sigma factor [Candidatus Krumholzibacteria bacterium]|nr:sigma-70 family RNA polymerase sigma factor [Candidatus Krumholzibacteria bacterium]